MLPWPEVDIVFREPSTALSPAPCESDPYGIENGGLACIIRSDENGRPAELDVDVLNRPEILNSQARDLHDVISNASIIELRRAPVAMADR
jgi:hypothetical protein